MLDAMKNNEKVIVGIKCKMCGMSHKISVLKKDFEKWNMDTGKRVQDVFPYLTINQRELLISGVCGECFDEIMDYD